MPVTEKVKTEVIKRNQCFYRYPISLVLAKLVSNLLIIGIVLASASEGEIKCKKRNLMLNQVAECCVKRLVANHNHFVTQGDFFRR